MPIEKIDASAPDPRVLARAAAILHRGGLVAFPTETVYGLGANALDAAAVRRIFAAKGRPSFNPLIAHVANVEAARQMSSSWPALADQLADALWPGPLTLVVAKHPAVPDELTAGLATVAIRVPSHPVARALIERAALPIAAPSANRYTHVSPTTAQHVAAGLGPRVDLILDAGPTSLGIESTVIDLSDDAPALLRPGTLGLAAIEDITGPLRRPAEADSSAPRRSPGMVGRHYAPGAELRIFPADRREALGQAVRAATAAGRRVGALLLSELDEHTDASILMPTDPDGYARELYGALHRLDARGCEVIVADAVPDTPAWLGVRDRLTRASRPA